MHHSAVKIQITKRIMIVLTFNFKWFTRQPTAKCKRVTIIFHKNWDQTRFCKDDTTLVYTVNWEIFNNIEENLNKLLTQ